MGRVPPAKLWSGRKLREFRERCKLSVVELGRRTFMTRQEIAGLEKTKMLPGLRVLQALIKGLDLDLFDLDELLRLDQVKPTALRLFRAACRLDGKTPAEALRDFVEVYPDKVKKEKMRERRRANGDTGEDSR